MLQCIARNPKTARQIHEAVCDVTISALAVLIPGNTDSTRRLIELSLVTHTLSFHVIFILVDIITINEPFADTPLATIHRNRSRRPPKLFVISGSIQLGRTLLTFKLASTFNNEVVYLFTNTFILQYLNIITSAIQALSALPVLCLTIGALLTSWVEEGELSVFTYVSITTLAFLS